MLERRKMFEAIIWGQRERGDALTPVIKPMDSEMRENQASVHRAWNQPQGGWVVEDHLSKPFKSCPDCPPSPEAAMDPGRSGRGPCANLIPAGHS